MSTRPFNDVEIIHKNGINMINAPIAATMPIIQRPAEPWMLLRFHQTSSAALPAMKDPLSTECHCA